MMLRERILILLFLGFCGYLAFEYASYEYIIYPHLVGMERYQAQEQAKRCQKAVLNETGRCQKFAEGLINDKTSNQWLIGSAAAFNEQSGPSAVEMDIDLICAFDQQGQPRYYSLGPIVSEATSFEKLTKIFSTCSKPLIGPDAPNFPRRGILRTEAGEIFFASIPYNLGKQRGVLVTGSVWTRDRARQLREQLMVDFTCRSIDEPIIDSVRQKITNQELVSDDEMIFYELGGNLLQTYTVLKDVQNRPALLLCSNSYRDFLARGKKMVYLAGFVKLGAVLAAIIFVIIFFQIEIVCPIKGLIRDIAAIGRGERIRSRGKRRDEIGKLSGEFDRVLERLDATQKKLVEKSYVSGMAEMSSGILHNARNALSPLVSGIERLQQQISSLPSERFRQAGDELQKQDLPEQRRQDFSRFLCLAGENILTSLTSAQNHLQELVGQVYQVEEMLNGQKTFRGAERPLESVEPKKLIEESIQLMPEALREDAKIIIDSGLAKLRPIHVHRVVFLQVVGNLLINAVESIRRAKPLYPKIYVHGAVEENDGIEMLHLAIEDNGSGIELEKLSSIFERGVSSKSRGLTGIGLHWCANTVSAMKGKIWVCSDGPGKGACFHILLPVSQEPEMLTVTERRYSNE